MKRIMIVCACAALLLAGCGQPAASRLHKTPRAPANPKASSVTLPYSAWRKTWHVAGFAVREIPLPADYKPNEGRELVVGTTLLEIGSAPPYTLTWQSLTSKRNGIVLEKGCPASTSSAYADLNDGYNLNNGYAPGYAGFVCAGKEQSELLLVHMPDMKVSTFPLPGDPGGLSAWVSGSADHPFLSWDVGINEVTNSGTFDMTTGKPVAHLPTTSSQPPGAITLASPNGTRYSINGNMVSKWNGSAFELLGTIPNPRVFAVDDNGAVWADEPSPSDVFADTIIRETPGSTKTRSWKIVGANVVVQPGFVSYTSGEDTLNGPVRIFFPEADRTIAIDNVYGQPFPVGFVRANDQIMITTSEPPVVIEIIPPS
jgi:hypothetical protein